MSVQSDRAPVRDVRREQADRLDWAAGAGEQWASAHALRQFLDENTHLVDAVRAFDWAALLPPGATVLDLGCGSGWLAGLLTREPAVERVIAWDSSRHLVEVVLPEMVALVEGDVARVERVCGDFLPLLLDDSSVDVIAMSSAFHHSDRPGALLDEMHRVLRPGGAVVLANETPWGRLQMTAWSARLLLATLARRRQDGHLATDHVLYDSALGDYARTLSQWRALFAGHRFSCEVVDTGLPSYKPHFRRRTPLQPSLAHFVLRPL
jgi:ubiquinone/menaquinone biosynthesis C-methylase UbiE